MDLLQTWTYHLLGYYTPAYLKPLYTLRDTLSSTLSPLLTRVTTNPDLTSILLLLALLFLSIKILDAAARALLFWVRLAVRLAFWGALAVGGLWVWTRGVEGTVEDLESLGRVWMGEYERFKEAGREGPPGRGWDQRREGGFGH
ncbi:hypothetical protein H2199_001565 [Coniosporium tulheliwenetii]|uniref:Uncharacterized protein n=1 Tax=Coniosporium tulheliwenetii TaxID=3383036 RepID=A0ACC2ZJN2_9PEZI|nr:hypothetical protein H2199_001565 [Cladosporium sp. JES 115]